MTAADVLEVCMVDAIRLRHSTHCGNTEVVAHADRTEVWLCGRPIAKLYYDPPTGVRVDRMEWTFAGNPSVLTFRRLNTLFKAFSQRVHSVGRDRGILVIRYHAEATVEVLRNTKWFDA